MAIADRRVQSGWRSYTNTNGYCYTDSHSNTYRYRYGDGHGYSYFNAQTDAHAEICANSEASSHTAAETVTVFAKANIVASGDK
jgi:hypothetical protein